EAGRRGCQPWGGGGDSGPLLGADGAARPDPRPGVRAVLLDPPRRRRHVPLGRTDAPDLHARSEDAAAAVDAIRRDDRGGRGPGSWGAARARPPLLLFSPRPAAPARPPGRARRTGRHAPPGLA